MVRINKILKNFILVIILFLFIGCPGEEFPPDDMGINIINNSNIEIVFYTQSIRNAVIDTSLNDELPWGNINNIDSSYIVLPHTSYLHTYYSKNLKTLLEQGWIHYYIFNFDSIKTISWERIRNEYIVAKRIDFDTWEDLEECNFTITYP